MSKSLEQWKNEVYNHVLKIDDSSADCVDVPKSWLQYLVGGAWQNSSGYGNAKDIYYNWSSQYVDRIPRGNAPKLGDIVCMNGAIGGGFGHTGVVVGISGNNITIYQQNTFTQQPVYTGVYNAYVSYIIGFLRPNGNAPFTVDAQAALVGYQRITNDVVNYRDGATRGSNIISKFEANETYDFKGFVHGENVDGNDVWFVGRYTGGYAWSGGFTDTGTHDLPDLTPAVVTPPAATLAGYQRIVGNSVINYRKAPVLAPDNVIKTFNPSEVLDFDAWTHGTMVDGNDVWFRGKYTGGWAHSGGFTDSTTHDLTEVVLEVTANPNPPTYPAPTTDKLVTKVVNKQNPLGSDYAPTDLVSVGGGQTLRKEAADSLALMQKQQALTVASGYRSYDTQVKVYGNEVNTVGQEQADRESARPGYSEHQTGLVMDFGPIDESFANSGAFTWLTANGYKYGWILRYTAPKESVTGYMSEPWHWRYVGVDVATDMHNKGVLTLEEYFGIKGGNYPAPVEPTDPTEPTTPTTPTDPSGDQDMVTKLLQEILDSLKSFFAFITNLFNKKK